MTAVSVRSQGRMPVRSAARSGRRNGRAAKPEDTNAVTLIGAVARVPVRKGGSVVFTCAGQVSLPSGKVLPWYHRVFVPAGFADGLVAGSPVEIRGQLDHRKFGEPGAVRSRVDVRAETLRVLDPARYEVRRLEGETPSFILAGGVNVVRLAGNLTRDAQGSILGNGEAFVRMNLAVESQGRAQFFIVKAAREQARGLDVLRRGARSGSAGR